MHPQWICMGNHLHYLSGRQGFQKEVPNEFEIIFTQVKCSPRVLLNRTM